MHYFLGLAPLLSLMSWVMTAWIAHWCILGHFSSLVSLGSSSVLFLWISNDPSCDQWVSSRTVSVWALFSSGYSQVPEPVTQSSSISFEYGCMFSSTASSSVSKTHWWGWRTRSAIFCICGLALRICKAFKASLVLWMSLVQIFVAIDGHYCALCDCAGHTS